jgi:hypothetical protein
LKSEVHNFSAWSYFLWRSCPCMGEGRNPHFRDPQFNVGSIEVEVESCILTFTVSGGA